MSDVFVLTVIVGCSLAFQTELGLKLALELSGNPPNPQATGPV